MSIALLDNPSKSHEILDDFESILWALLHTSLHYFKHKNFNLDVRMFDEQYPRRINGLWCLCGGTKKRNTLSRIASLVEFDSNGLNQLINDLAAEFHNYYSLVEAVSCCSKNKEDSRKPQPQDVGKIRTIRKQPIQRPKAPNRVVRESPEEAQKKLDECRKKLSNVDFWAALFDDALNDRSQWQPDASGFDQYPSRTQKQEAKDIAKARLSSMHTGSQLAAEAVAAARLHKENTDSDDDDANESCECREDAEARMNEMVEEPPVSEPPSPTSTSFTDFNAPPRRSRTVRTLPTRFSSSSQPLLSGHSGGPRPPKRSIDNVAVASSSALDSSFPEPPPQKKTRSQSKAAVMVAPNSRTARSSSKKPAIPPPSQTTEEVDTATKGKKSTRPRRALKKAQSSADIAATRPRREGLRQKPARSAQYGKN